MLPGVRFMHVPTNEDGSCRLELVPPSYFSKKSAPGLVQETALKSTSHRQHVPAPSTRKLSLHVTRSPVDRPSLRMLTERPVRAPLSVPSTEYPCHRAMVRMLWSGSIL